MEQTVKTKTLLEYFAEAQSSEFNMGQVQSMIDRVLNKEIRCNLKLNDYDKMSERENALLSELRDNFDFESTYGVRIFFDAYVDDSSITSDYSCRSNEEFMDYLVNERKVVEPDPSDAEIYIEGENRRVPNCRIKNLRLKDDDGVWASKIAQAIAATGIDLERVPALMHRVYSEQWELAGAPSWDDITGKK